MRVLSSVSALVVVVLACSPPNVSQSDPNAACADFAYARCTHLANDCSITYAHFRYGNADPVGVCRDVITATCVASIVAPGSGSTPTAIESCAQVTPKWACSDFINYINPPPECAPARGALATGAACARDSQCQSGYCQFALGAACGTCAPTPQAGAPCADSSNCGTELNLACETSTNVCVPIVTEGAQCSSTTGTCNSGAGLVCSAGTCDVAVSTPSAPCVPNGAGCAFVDGLVCNSALKICQNVQIASAGQPCGTVNDQTTSCEGDALCLGEEGSSTPGTCAAFAPAGAPCDLMAGPTCISGLRCVVSTDGGTSGTCQIPAGAACQ